MYDTTKPKKVKQFLETYCVQSKGQWANKPLTILPWQWEDVIVPIYGNVDRDGNRIIRRASIWLPKKSGKSTLLSGLALWQLLEEPGAQVIICATTKEQASIIYTEAAEMALAHPVLRKRLWTRKNLKIIEDKKRKSILKVLSTDQPRRLAGFNASAIFLDEIGGWGAHGRESYGHLARAGIARKQPLEISISHAYYDRETIGHELYQYAKEVKAGTITDHQFHPVVYEATGNWNNEDEWKKANPSLGHTITLEDMRSEYERATQSPREEVEFRTLRLNQWCFGGLDQWIRQEDWQACYEDFTEEDFDAMSVWGGIDLARKHDIASTVWLAERDGSYYILPRFYVAENTALMRERKNEGRYSQWSRDNHLTMSKGDLIDPRDIRADCVDDAQRYDVTELRYDANNGQAENLCHVQLGIEDGIRVTECPFHYSHLDSSTSRLETLIKEKKIKHNGNPVLNWMIGNCRIKVNDKGQVLPDKIKSQGRIDGIAALVLALSAAISEPQESIYNTRGLYSF